MKIGFLPLYVKLYDDFTPKSRPRHEAFYEEVAGILEEKGATVVRAPFCRLAEEFEAAVKLFEEEQADAIVTLHMAYSPSLESVDALSRTALPVIVLDTTSTLTFTNMQSPGEITYCHGIHGVMDMCSMLTRRGKAYAIAAGHYKESDCIDRALGYAKAAVAAREIKNAKVAMIGGLFDGMGDFRVPFEELKARFGIQVLDKKPEELKPYVEAVTEADIQAEYEKDTERFDFDESCVEAEYKEALRSCLAVRACVEQEALTAFTANFRTIGPKAGINDMPFLEACKSMERGIGYAGEGDPLTAAFTGALLSGYPETSFVEIFCPDWENDVLFMSHMGEVNYRIINNRPYIRGSKVNYAEGNLPYAGAARMKGGKGVFVNISRGQDDYKLVLSATEMLDYSEDNFPTSVRGWMKLGTPCSEFLEALSEHGATHHSIFVYGATVKELAYFGKLLGLETVII
ncbi:MAG: hypothetical protein IKL80_04205 [Clostridia bacterium]|nr:hypothetical protein [Clostridia bacterium]